MIDIVNYRRGNGVSCGRSGQIVKSAGVFHRSEGGNLVGTIKSKGQIKGAAYYLLELVLAGIQTLIGRF